MRTNHSCRACGSQFCKRLYHKARESTGGPQRFIEYGWLCYACGLLEIEATMKVEHVPGPERDVIVYAHGKPDERVKGSGAGIYWTNAPTRQKPKDDKVWPKDWREEDK